MTRRSPRQQMFRVASLAFAALPFAFAAIRAMSTRSDFRMLWMAIASLLGTMAVVALGRLRKRSPRGVLGLSAAALLVGMLLAGLTARLAGATAPAGIWPVAFVLAFCWAASFALDTLARPRAGEPSGGDTR